mmetsp:Transcript_50655/g.115042  ORF Transcript_50655/g.115042 Transcript_50655/m.115042 type:complete len:260 (-) Transcript_50655:83-862(-)
MDAARLLTDKGRLEEHLRATEALVSDDNNVAVRELVALLESGGLGGGLHLRVKVEGDEGKLFLDVAHDLALRGRGEGVAALGHDLHHVVGEVATREVEAHDGVRKSIAFVNGHRMGDTVARVHHTAGGATRRVKREDGLDVDVHGRDVEGLEHDLGHALAIGLRVEGCLGEKNRVLFGGNTELVVEGVVPDLLHVVPVGHDAVLDGVLEGEHATLGLRLVTHVSVFLVHADHDPRVLRAADNRRKHRTRRIVTRETSLG